MTKTPYPSPYSRSRNRMLLVAVVSLVLVVSFLPELLQPDARGSVPTSFVVIVPLYGALLLTAGLLHRAHRKWEARIAATTPLLEWEVPKRVMLETQLRHYPTLLERFQRPALILMLGLTSLFSVRFTEGAEMNALWWLDVLEFPLLLAGVVAGSWLVGRWLLRWRLGKAGTAVWTLRLYVFGFACPWYSLEWNTRWLLQPQAVQYEVSGEPGYGDLVLRYKATRLAFPVPVVMAERVVSYFEQRVDDSRGR